MAGTVDEEGSDEEPEQTAPKKPIEWDRICAYKTFKVVRIKDRNLGVLYWSIVMCVILYIIIGALGMEGKHQYQEPGIGTVITRFHGKAFFGKKVYDEADLRFPEIDPFGAFIMTKAITVPDQTIGRCVDFDDPCPCREGAECVDGFCEDDAWCPSIGGGNAAEAPGSAVIETVEGLQHTILEILCGIAFPGIGNDFFVAGKAVGHNRFKNITLGDLLASATPPIALEDVLETGALIGVSFFWNCDVAVACEPSGVVVKRLDHGKGFVQRRVKHKTVGGASTRDATYMHGLRILVDSSGIGRKFSMVLIIIQIGSGLALLRTASMTSDFLMLKLYEPELRKAYYKCKIETSEDYSDLQDRINLIKEQKKVKPLMGAGKPGHEKQGGAQLGLGPGGKGGMASQILAR